MKTRDLWLVSGLRYSENESVVELIRSKKKPFIECCKGEFIAGGEAYYGPNYRRWVGDTLCKANTKRGKTLVEFCGRGLCDITGTSDFEATNGIFLRKVIAIDIATSGEKPNAPIPSEEIYFLRKFQEVIFIGTISTSGSIRRVNSEYIISDMSTNTFRMLCDISLLNGVYAYIVGLKFVFSKCKYNLSYVDNNEE